MTCVRHQLCFTRLPLWSRATKMHVSLGTAPMSEHVPSTRTPAMYCVAFAMYTAPTPTPPYTHASPETRIRAHPPTPSGPRLCVIDASTLQYARTRHPPPTGPPDADTAVPPRLCSASLDPRLAFALQQMRQKGTQDSIFPAAKQNTCRLIGPARHGQKGSGMTAAPLPKSPIPVPTQSGSGCTMCMPCMQSAPANKSVPPPHTHTRHSHLLHKRITRNNQTGVSVTWPRYDLPCAPPSPPLHDTCRISISLAILIGFLVLLPTLEAEAGKGDSSRGRKASQDKPCLIASRPPCNKKNGSTNLHLRQSGLIPAFFFWPGRVVSCRVLSCCPRRLPVIKKRTTGQQAKRGQGHV